MKRILFITAFNPSKSDAGSNYTRQLLMELGKFSYVDLIVFKYAEQKLYEPQNNIRIVESIDISKVSKICGLLSLPTIFPLFSSRFSCAIAKRVNHYIHHNSYDTIYFDFSQTFAYSLFVSHPRKLFMAHDVIKQRYDRRNKLLAWWVAKSECRLLKTANKIFTFSDKDCYLIRDLYSLDSESTSFFIQKEAEEAVPDSISDYYIFYGNWNRADNYEALGWFLDNVYSELDDKFMCRIIGMRLPEEYKERIAHLKNVEYIGFVDNPYPILANAKALISPLHSGAGVKVKVIEALACGTPVIGTDISFEGIDEKYQKFMIRANAPVEFRTEIKRIHFSVEERRAYKQMFIESYINKPILKYLSDI